MTTITIDITDGKVIADADMRPAEERGVPPYKAVLAKVDIATHKQLKRIAADEEAFIGDLLVEGLNLVFASRDLPQIAVRISPPDERAA